MDVLINFLDGPSGAEGLCDQLEPILRLVGYVILAVKVAVPIILIVVGMFDMAKAVSGKDENAIKAAQSGLIKKAIAAVVVFLVATLVSLLMTLVGGEDYEACTRCLATPWSCAEPIQVGGENSGGNTLPDF